MSLVTRAEPFGADELKQEGDCGLRQREISRQMTRLVDVLYALVLVQGAINYSSIFTIGEEFRHLDRFAPVVLALLLIYFTAIQSFIDYHLASEAQPYRLLDGDRRRRDLLRFYLDVVTVGLYSFLLLKCHVLIQAPAADLGPVFWALVAMFLLYLVWGWLRQWTKPSQAAQPYGSGLLLVCLALYATLAIAYCLLADGWGGNAVFLAVALLIMCVYRWANWSQNQTCTDSAAPVAPAARKQPT
jgi:hypothetical protein